MNNNNSYFISYLIGQILGICLYFLVWHFFGNLFSHFRTKYKELKDKEEWQNAIQKIKNSK